MYCENCGKKIPDDSQFCPECGAPVHHEDESLIARAARKDNDAIHQLMEQYKGMVRYQARMYVKNEDDVNEIEQQVYIKAFSKTSDLTDEKKFGGWLKTIAINTAKDYVTSAFKKRSVMFTDLDDTNNDMVYDAADERIDHVPEAQMDETSRRDIILKVLDSLPETQRTVIVMHYYDNLSFKDIAEQLDIPMSTVTGRAQQAKNSIKASVTEIQNREGIKLYNLSPIAFFLWLLGLERKAPVTVTPPVVGKTVKVTKTEPAKKDKPNYGNHGDKVNKTVKTKAAKTTAKATGKAAAGKAAGTGFVATTAGKVVIAGAVAVAVGTGAVAGKHYRDTETGQAKIQESEQKNSKNKTGNKKQTGDKKITSDLVSQSVKKGNQSGIVWVKEPGSMDIDDFEDLQSARTGGTIMGRYSTVEENNGYSPDWIINSNSNYLVTSYSENGIIVKKDKLLGIGDYTGKVITKPSYESIEADNALDVYRVLKPGEDFGTSDAYYLDSDYSVKNAGSGFGDGDWTTFKMFISGNTVYGLDQDGWEGDLVEDAGQYDMKAPTIMPSINGYQSGDVNLNSPDGFKLLQSGSNPVDLPENMTPTYYASALKYNTRFNELMNSYDYNTCFVNDVIKLQDQKKQIHLWDVKTKKFITDQSFDDATFYEDGYIGVKKNDKWAFMDMSGNVVTDYLFNKVSGLYEGKVYVNYQGKPGILDLKKSVENLGISEKEDQKKGSGQKQSSGKQSSDFSKVAGDYVFSSGAEGWGTDLKVNADGTFSGVYSDSDMGDTGPGYPKGLMKYAKYSGKFKDLKKLEDNRYQVTLDGDLKYANKPGTSEIKDQTLYDYTGVYGFEDTDTFTVILPGYDQSKLDEQVRSWIYPVAGTESSQSSVTKQNLIINDADLDTFVQMKQ